jgi:hypothetical protein
VWRNIKFLSKDLTYGYHFLGFHDKVDPLRIYCGSILGGFDAVRNVANGNVDENIYLLIDNIKTIQN